MSLESLGWSSFFADHLPASLDPSSFIARVAVEHRDRVHLLTPDGPAAAWAPKLPELRAHAGDWVVVQPDLGGPGTLVRRLPRRTALTRKAPGQFAGTQVIAANVDVVFVVTSMNADFNLRRIERYLAAVYASGAQPVVVLTKADLAVGLEQSYADRLRPIAPDVHVLSTSAVLGTGLDALEHWLISGRTIGFVGSSGVGKSTLVNALLRKEAQKTSGIRLDDARGRHTTSHRQLFELAGDRGVLVDTPGMRELGLGGGDGIAAAFSDIETLARSCRFRDCTHDGEPGCAVISALDEGELSPARLVSWDRLSREAAAAERRNNARTRRAEGKRRKRAAKERKRFRGR